MYRCTPKRVVNLSRSRGTFAKSLYTISSKIKRERDKALSLHDWVPYIVKEETALLRLDFE